MAEQNTQRRQVDAGAPTAEPEDRTFQTWCFQQAIRENVIVALPTGAGKTRVAIRVLQHYRTLLDGPTQVAVLITPTMALCCQQAKVLQQAGLRVALVAAGAVEELEEYDGSEFEDLDLTAANTATADNTTSARDQQLDRAASAPQQATSRGATQGAAAGPQTAPSSKPAHTPTSSASTGGHGMRASPFWPPPPPLGSAGTLGVRVARARVHAEEHQQRWQLAAGAAESASTLPRRSARSLSAGAGRARDAATLAVIPGSESDGSSSSSGEEEMEGRPRTPHVGARSVCGSDGDGVASDVASVQSNESRCWKVQGMGRAAARTAKRLQLPDSVTLGKRLQAGRTSRERMVDLVACVHVLVATPGELLHLFTHALLSVSRIRWLILDEAHHADSQHAFAQVLQFVAQAPPAQRPRVLGLSATPLQVLEKELHPDGSQRLSRTCSLERITGARIVGANDWAAVMASVPVPCQRVVTYRPQPLPATNPVHEMIVTLRAARDTLAAAAQMRHVRNSIAAQDSLVRRLGQMTCAQGIGIVSATGTSIYRYLAKQVEAVEVCAAEMGLWVALVTAKNVLLSSTDTSLVMNLDPDLEPSDDDDEDNGDDEDTTMEHMVDGSNALHQHAYSGGGAASGVVPMGLGGGGAGVNGGAGRMQRPGQEAANRRSTSEGEGGMDDMDKVVSACTPAANMPKQPPHPGDGARISSPQTRAAPPSAHGASDVDMTPAGADLMSAARRGGTAGRVPAAAQPGANGAATASAISAGGAGGVQLAAGSEVPQGSGIASVGAGGVRQQQQQLWRGSGGGLSGIPKETACLLLPRAQYKPWQLQLHAAMVQQRKEQRDLERKLKAVLGPSQIARLTTEFARRPAGGDSAQLAGGIASDIAHSVARRARKGARYFAALEQMASQQVLQNVMEALGAACCRDEDDHYQYLQDVAEVLEKQGLAAVVEGSLSRFIEPLLPSAEQLSALLQPCLVDREQQADPNSWFSTKLRTLLSIVLRPPLQQPAPAGAAKGNGAVAPTAAAMDGGGASSDGADNSAARPADGAPAAVEGTMVFFSCKVHVVAMHQLLKALPAAVHLGLRSAPFLGDTGGGSLAQPLSMGMLAQQQAMRDFRDGITNVLLATHVGAEGLDFGCCSRVLLLEVPRHVIQLTQCKGRARKLGSECVILMPAGSVDDERMLERLIRLESAMNAAIRYKTLVFMSSCSADHPANGPGTVLIPSPLPTAPLATPAASGANQAGSVMGPPPSRRDEGGIGGPGPAASQGESARVMGPPPPCRPLIAPAHAHANNRAAPRHTANADSNVDVLVVAAAALLDMTQIPDAVPEPEMPDQDADLILAVDPCEGADKADVLPGPATTLRLSASTTASPPSASIRCGPQWPSSGQVASAGAGAAGAFTASAAPAFTMEDYVVPATGARCTPGFAEALLVKYCCSLPGNDVFTQLKPQYAISQYPNGLFSCLLTLPSNSRTRGTTQALLTFHGPLQKGRKSAQAAACLEAVRALHADGILDDYLEPASLAQRLSHTGTRFAAHAVLAARIVQGEIVGYMPRVTLPNKLAHVLRPVAQRLGDSSATQSAGTAPTATTGGAALPSRTTMPDGSQRRSRCGGKAGGPATLAASMVPSSGHKRCAASPATSDVEDVEQQRSVGWGRSRGKTQGPGAAATEGFDSFEGLEATAEATQPTPMAAQELPTPLADRNRQGGGALLPQPMDATTPLPAPAAAQPASRGGGGSGRVRHAAAGSSLAKHPTMKWLYGWVVQPFPNVGAAARGPLSADLYLPDGPWPQAPVPATCAADQARHQAAAQLVLTLGVPVPAALGPQERHTPPPAGVAAAACPRGAAVLGGSPPQVASAGHNGSGAGGQRPAMVAAAAEATPAAMRVVSPVVGAGEPVLYPFGLLLPNQLPASSYIPFSVWLPNKVHALASVVELGKLRLSAGELQALRCGHEAYLSLSLLRRVGIKEKPTAGEEGQAAKAKGAKDKTAGPTAPRQGGQHGGAAPGEGGQGGTGPGGSEQQALAHAGAEAVEAAGGRQLTASCAAAGAGAALPAGDEAAATPGQAPKDKTARRKGQGKVPPGPTGGRAGAAAAPPGADNGADASVSHGGGGWPTPSLQRVVLEWRERTRLLELEAALRAAGRGVQLPAPAATLASAGGGSGGGGEEGVAGRAEAGAARGDGLPTQLMPQEPWYLVVPVILTSVHGGDALPRKKAQLPQGPPHTERPHASGAIDWAALCRLAAGPVPVQDVVPLGPFAGAPTALHHLGHPTSHSCVGTLTRAGTVQHNVTALKGVTEAAPRVPPQLLAPLQQQQAQRDASPEQAAEVAASLHAVLQGRLVVPAYRPDLRLVYLSPAQRHTVRVTGTPAAAGDSSNGASAGGGAAHAPDAPRALLATRTRPEGAVTCPAVKVDVLVGAAAAMAIDTPAVAGDGASANVGVGAGGARQAPGTGVGMQVDIGAAAGHEQGTGPWQAVQEQRAGSWGAAAALPPVVLSVEVLEGPRLLTLGDTVVGAPAQVQWMQQCQGRRHADGATGTQRQPQQQGRADTSELPQQQQQQANGQALVGGRDAGEAWKQPAVSRQALKETTYQSMWFKQLSWLGVTALPTCTPLITAEVGTTRFIKRNLTKPAETIEDLQRAHARKQRYKAQQAANAAKANDNPQGAPGAAPQPRNPASALDSALGTAALAVGGRQGLDAAATIPAPAGATGTGAVAPAAVADGVAVDGAGTGIGAGGQVMLARAASPLPVLEAVELVLPGEGAKCHNIDVLLPAATLLHPLTLYEWAGLSGLPSLVKRLQSVLSVHEWHQVVMPHIRPQLRLPPLRDVIVCFTPRTVNESFNYEGAELLGDAVLDYLAATYLFHALPHEHEGVLTECKVRLVANEVLLRLTESQHAKQQTEAEALLADMPELELDEDHQAIIGHMRKRGHTGAGASSKWGAVLPLQQYIQCRPLDAPWEWTVGADLARQDRRQRKVAGKTVGDVVEALVGAAFLDAGGAAALQLATTAARGTCAVLASVSQQQQVEGLAMQQQLARCSGGSASFQGAASVDHTGAAGGAAVIAHTQLPLAEQPPLQQQQQQRMVESLTHWDHHGLTVALLRAAEFCHHMQVLPGSVAVLAAVHQSTGIPYEIDPQMLARVRQAQERAPVSAKQRSVDLRLSEELRPLLGHYCFRRPELLREALTHCSHPVPPCNQRLEFLGDAVLGLICVCHLVAASCQSVLRRMGAKSGHVRGLDLIDPGLITDRGNRLVSNKHLSLLCVRCGLHKHLRAGLPAVRRHLVARFEAQLDEFAARDEAEYEAERQRRQQWAEEGVEYERRRRKYGQSTGAPKLLADLVEALLGAVMIDSGGDIAEVWRVLWGMVEKAGMTRFYIFD